MCILNVETHFDVEKSVYWIWPLFKRKTIAYGILKSTAVTLMTRVTFLAKSLVANGRERSGKRIITKRSKVTAINVRMEAVVETEAVY